MPPNQALHRTGRVRLFACSGFGVRPAGELGVRLLLKGCAVHKGVKIEEFKNGGGRIALKNTIVRVRYDGYLSRGDQFQTAICICH